VEGQPRPLGHVRGVDEDHGSLSLDEVSKGFPLENIFIVILGGQVAPVEIGRRKTEPVDGVQKDTGGESALDVLLQETALEIFEDSVAEKTLIGRGETPARNARDDVHLIHQSPLPALQGDLRIPEFLEDAVGKGGRPCPSPGKRKDQEKFFRLSGDPMF
jgi:hypothetical protein